MREKSKKPLDRRLKAGSTSSSTASQGGKSSQKRRLKAPIRWEDVPHDQIRGKIYARLDQNAVLRSTDDSLRHILRRQLRDLQGEDHRRFIELKAREIVEHLRCTRDAYREYVDEHDCHPVLEAYWVVLRLAVFPTAIQVLRDSVVDYLRQTRVPARDLTLLFGVLTHSCYSKGPGLQILQKLDLDDDAPASDAELHSVGGLVNEDTMLWFRDIGEGGAVGYPFGGGPFALDDAMAIRRSWNLCALREHITVPAWMRIREKLWYFHAPWTQGLSSLFGCVQEELLSQWRALPPDSHARGVEWKKQLSTLAQVAVPQKAHSSPAGRPKSKIVADRKEVIRRVAAAGFEGESYCKRLDDVGLSTPLDWQKRDGCPKKYSDAWKHPSLSKKWRQRIANEKSKATSDNVQTRQKRVSQ